MGGTLGPTCPCLVGCVLSALSGFWPVSLGCSDEGWLLWDLSLCPMLGSCSDISCVLSPRVCDRLSVELGRKREVWLQPTCLLWADQRGELSSEQDSQLWGWPVWASLNQHGEGSANWEKPVQETEAPELPRESTARCEQAPYRQPFSSETAFLWPVTLALCSHFLRAQWSS